ncbi:MAG: carboxypeptidase-like regulatory domain-containing protein [Bacteroidota bacterium]|nr:carboxypeptidase-like regulatory domain-containing protein [Bacteroidota bacterium]
MVSIFHFPSVFLKSSLLFCVLLAGFSSGAQTTGDITISGQVYDKESKLPLPKLMVINKRTNNGYFADAEGKFTIKAKQTDTIMFSAVGFHLKKICLKDSAYRPMYNVFIPLEKLSFTLKEVSVFAPRTLKEIDKEILGLDSSKAYSHYNNINPLASPITYLYERFSKFGKSKQKVAEWENEDLKEDILKELFRLYIKNDIMELNEEEFEAFITYCNLSESFIKNATQFELVMAIKGKYESFKYRWK